MNPSAVLRAQQGSSKQMTRFNYVSEVYDRGIRPALDDVSVKINRGEFVFLVGASRSGKPTFLRLAIRKERPVKERIHVLERDLSKISSWRVPQLRQEVGLVFQDFRLLESKTVLGNMALASQVIGKPRHYVLSAVPEAPDLMGLTGKGKRPPHELSGGKQQRVVIARAMVNRPKLLLADKPTGNLNPSTSVGIMRLLSRINRQGTTAVMATHDDEIVDQMCKHVIELKGGEVVHNQDRGVCGPDHWRRRTVGLRFILSKTAKGMYRDLAMMVSVILVTFVSLLFIGASSSLQSQISTVRGDQYDKVEVPAYMCPKSLTSSNCANGETTAAQINRVENLITSGAPSGYVRSYQMETKVQAYQNLMKAYTKSAAGRNTTEDMMPVSFRTKFKDTENYKLVVKRLEGHSGMGRVVDQHSTLESLFLVMNRVSWVTGELATIMTVTAVPLISTTIRPSAVSRPRQTGIMRLVGASNLFIQLPFILEGVIAVLAGAILAVTTLWLGVRYVVGGWLASSISFTSAFIGTRDVLSLSPQLALAAIALATVSSVLSLSKYARI